MSCIVLTLRVGVGHTFGGAWRHFPGSDKTPVGFAQLTEKSSKKGLLWGGGAAAVAAALLLGGSSSSNSVSPSN